MFIFWLISDRDTIFKNTLNCFLSSQYCITHVEPHHVKTSHKIREIFLQLHCFLHSFSHHWCIYTPNATTTSLFKNALKLAIRNTTDQIYVWWSPVNRNNDSRSQEVRVLCCELPGDIPVGLQGPGSVVGAAVQLVNLSTGGTEQRAVKQSAGRNRHERGRCRTSGRRARSSRYMTLSL